MTDDLLARLPGLSPDDLAGLLGPGAPTVYLSDYQDAVLIPLGPRSEAGPARLPVDGSAAGQAFLSQQPVLDDGSIWLPLTNRRHPLGVLHLAAPPASPLPGRRDAPLDGTQNESGWLEPAWLERTLRFADLLALAIDSAEPGTDAFARARRREPITLTAELQWSLLPPTCVADRTVTMAGRLEPAYEVGGDSFDYAINAAAGGRGVAHLGIFDPVGHDLRATMLAALAVGAYRHARRGWTPLADIGSGIDSAIVSQYSDSCFVTGQLAELDLATGAFTWTNAGHPLPLLLRDGAARPLSLRPDPPWGLGHHSSRLDQVQLEPGDRVLLYTDGIVEARSPAGDPYGADRLGALLAEQSTRQPLPVLLRSLMLDLLAHRGTRLVDDASAVMLHWHGPDGAHPEVQAADLVEAVSTPAR